MISIIEGEATFENHFDIKDKETQNYHREHLLKINNEARYAQLTSQPRIESPRVVSVHASDMCAKFLTSNSHLVGENGTC